MTDRPHSPDPGRPAGAPWPLADAARFLGVSPRHLARLIDAGKVATIALGRRRFVPDAEVRRVAAAGC